MLQSSYCNSAQTKEILPDFYWRKSHFEFIHVLFFWRSFSTKFNFRIISFCLKIKLTFDWVGSEVDQHVFVMHHCNISSHGNFLHHEFLIFVESKQGNCLTSFIHPMVVSSLHVRPMMLIFGLLFTIIIFKFKENFSCIK